MTGTNTYYPAGGAMRINGTLYYTLKDHLGSASVVTDSAGNIVGEQRYYPFGETRLSTGTMYTDKLFTGQRNIAGLGIYHYQSRFYSLKLGRFLSADSLVPNPFNPQDFNRFAYVRNNPVRYIDPSGHVCSDPEDPTPTCDNSAMTTTKVGDKVVRGSGLNAGKPKVVKQPKVASGNKAQGLLGGGSTPPADPNLGGSQPNPSPAIDNNSDVITNCSVNSAGGFDSCYVNISVPQAENIYENELFWNYQVPLIVVGVLAGFVLGAAIAAGIIPVLIGLLAIAAVEIYIGWELIEISQISTELGDGLDGRLTEDQPYIPFETSQSEAWGPIEFGWTGGSDSQTISSPLAQHILLDIIFEP